MIYLMAYHQMLNYFLTMHLFSVMHDINAFASVLNGDFKKIKEWAFQWKMSCHPHGSKQKKTHPSLVFNNSNISHATSKNHLGVTLDFKSIFNEHFVNVLHEIDRMIGLLCNLQNSVPRKTITICKAFARPHLDHGNVL